EGVPRWRRLATCGSQGGRSVPPDEGGAGRKPATTVLLRETPSDPHGVRDQGLRQCSAPTKRPVRFLPNRPQAHERSVTALPPAAPSWSESSARPRDRST